MIFSTKKANDIATKDVAFIEAGIHENVKLTGVRSDKSMNGNLFVEFKFTNEAGMSFTHTEWEPTQRAPENPDSFQKKLDGQVKRILQILECFYPKESLVFEGATYQSFIGWVCSVMDSADKTKQLRVKVVYNDRGYTTLPKYAVFTFIEPMSTSAENSKIKVLGIDVMVRPVQADKEDQYSQNTFIAPAQAPNNPFANVETPY